MRRLHHRGIRCRRESARRDRRERRRLDSHRRNDRAGATARRRHHIRSSCVARALEQTARRGLSVKAKVAVLVFPGTNSEIETWRICRDVGLDTDVVHWSQAATLPKYGAYVLPGGFAYEDRIRAGAISAHDPRMDYVIEGAQNGKLVLGICTARKSCWKRASYPVPDPFANRPRPSRAT